MEQILKEHERLENKANLGKAIDDVVRIIDQLKTAKEQVAAGTSRASSTALSKHILTNTALSQTPTMQP